MAVDYGSLLLAMGFAGACLVLTLLVTWASARTESFMLTWVWGVSLIVGAVFLYGIYIRNADMGLATVSLGMLLVGLALLVGAAEHFRTAIFPAGRTIVAIAVSLGVTLPGFFLGYDGVGFMMANFAAGALLLAAAAAYWQGRQEAPIAIASLTVLYSITGLSFLLCGFVLVTQGQVKIGHAPNNWAEDLNILVCIAAVCCIGAVSLALNQTRLARSHRRDALTDAHTGLLNRRALFDAYGDAPLTASTAVIVFDLDNFKDINDRFGHAVGDRVLTEFAAVLRAAIRDTDVAARIGGEEFAVVMPEATPTMAAIIAERIRAAFSVNRIDTGKGRLACTVSAGVAIAMDSAQPLDRVISRADNALYDAKRGGRNRVASDELRRAS